MVTASEWVYRHVPAGSKILSQHWDEGFPFSLPGHSAGAYKVIEFGYYEPDNPAKIQKLGQELAQCRLHRLPDQAAVRRGDACAGAFPADAATTSTSCSPATSATRWSTRSPRGPSLFGIEIPDELADESLTVYDHPKVLIFQNTGHLRRRR